MLLKIVQINVLYVKGLPKEIAKKEILSQENYFGSYGIVKDISISYEPHKKLEGSYGVYIVFQNPLSVALAIQVIYIYP